MNKVPQKEYKFPPRPGLFRNVLKFSGPWSLPTWLPSKIVGQHFPAGKPTNPVGAHAFFERPDKNFNM